MQNKLEELKQKFLQDDNVVGSKLADTLNIYLEEFVEELKSRLLSEKNAIKEPVKKLVNCLVPADKSRGYLQKHMYPVLLDGNIYMLRSEVDDIGVIEKLNEGIRTENKSNSCLESRERVGVAYVFVEATLKQTIDLMEAKEYRAIITDKNGKVYEIGYYLCWSDLLIKQYRKMRNLSKIYDDDTPSSYAPYSTRLFSIEMDLTQINTKDVVFGSIDFKFKENGLEEYVLCNREMLWNVKFDTAGIEIEPTKNPVGEIVKWKYRFEQVKDNQYITPVYYTYPSFEVRRIDKTTIDLEFENINNSGFHRVTIYDINDKDYENIELYYTNYNLDRLDNQHRIRSIADIKYELSKFYKYDRVRIGEVYFKKSDQNEHITKFPSEMSMYDRGRFGYKNTNNVYIQFVGDKQYIFFEDYANFVLGVLIYLFPEIGWEGVV